MYLSFFFSFFQTIDELLDFCERYQRKWMFLSRILHDMSMSTKNIELVSLFLLILY